MSISTKRPAREVKNTYRLPQGEPIRRELKRWFRDQREAVMGWLRTGERPDAGGFKFNRHHDASGRFSGGSGGGWSSSHMQRRKGRKRYWDTREQPAPARVGRATDRLQAIYDKHPVHQMPTLHDHKKGETVTVKVTKNASYFAFHGEKKFKVQTIGSKTGLNDSRAFNDVGNASRYAGSWHRALVRDGLKPKGDSGLSTKAAVDDLTHIPDWDWFGLGTLPMSERMAPLLETIWDQQGRAFTDRIGLDPDSWDVTNPKTQEAIDKAALDFCSVTNATTTLSIDDALAETRKALTAGLIEQGESVAELTKRIKGIFTGAETWRARAIAASEASRATHAAQQMAGEGSGVVTGWEWLLSSDACPLCQVVGRKAKYVRSGQPFAVVGDHPTYSTIRHPPLHVSCQCSLVPVLDIDKQPKWADTLDQPEPEEEDYAPGEAPEKSKAYRIALALKSHAPKVKPIGLCHEP